MHFDHVTATLTKYLHYIILYTVVYTSGDVSASVVCAYLDGKHIALL